MMSVNTPASIAHASSESSIVVSTPLYETSQDLDSILYPKSEAFDEEAEKIFEAARLRAPLIEAGLRPKIAEVDEEIQMLVDLKEELRLTLTNGGARRDRYFMEEFPFLVRE
jgi:hypothetical protein